MKTKNAYLVYTLLAILPMIPIHVMAHDGHKDSQDISIVHKQSHDSAVAQDISLLTRELGASTEEIQESLAFQEQFEELFTNLIENYPNQISRVWLEPAPAQQAYLEFVGEAPEVNTSLNVDIFSGGEFSFLEQNERVSYLNDLLKANNYANFVIFYDHKTGLIKLEIKVERHSLAPTLEELDWILSNPNVLDADEESVFRQLSVREIDYEVVVGPGEIYELDHSRGGNWLQDDDNRECTSGWAVTGPNGDCIVTAAHCRGLNQFEETPSIVYSMTWRSQEYDRGDAEYHTTVHIEPAEYWATATNLRDVTGIKKTFFMFPGRFVCEYGRSSNTRTCIHLVISNFVITTYSNGDTIRNLVRVSGDNSIGGDSGGPWSWGTVAWGVHSASNEVTSVFTPVQRVQKELDVTIKTQ